MKIEWEDAMHDEEPRDQHASTAVLDHGYWSLGPEADGLWSVTLIQQDESLDEIFAWDWRNLASEEEAKATAQAIEDDPTPLQPDLVTR